MELVIEGNALIKHTLQKCSIGIEEGKIISIKKILHGDTHLDFGEKMILPAAIDVHVHFRDPGMTTKEDFYTGTKAAAYGGVTCILDMPNTHPPTSNEDTLNHKIRTVEKKACIDYGLYACLTLDNMEKIRSLSKKCKAFKVYLASTDKCYLPSSHLSHVLKNMEKTGKVLAIHAEEESCIQHYKKQATGPYSYHMSRPPECEIIALRKIVDVAKKHGVHIHICHLSSSQGLQERKKSHTNISIGVTPHHLFLTSRLRFKPPGFGKVNPPLRNRGDCQDLFNGLKTGLIDLVESDHAPHTREEKKDFRTAPPGVPGVETRLPLLLWAVKKRWLPLNRMVTVVAKRPSEIYNLKKGEIKIGNDADLIITDLKEEKIGDLHSKCGWTPFQGKKGIFPRTVFLRGTKIIDNKEFIGTKGIGRLIT